MATPFLSTRAVFFGLTACLVAACSESTAPPKPASISPSVSTAVDGTAGLPLAASPTFVVKDGNGNTLGGVSVMVAVTAGGGTIPDAPTKTVSGGPTPVGTWTLGKTAGLNSVTVTVEGLPVATISVNGKAGPPAAIVFVSGANQSALAGTVLPAAVAQLRDQFANGIAGASISFTVADGGGTVAGAATVAVPTDASGNATVPAWKLGKSAVPQSLRAQSNGITATLGASIQSSYDVDLRFFGPTMPPLAAAAFIAAAARIKGSVVGDVQDVNISGPIDLTDPITGCGVPATIEVGTLDDVIIYASVAPIDGPNKILASAGPCFIRSNTSTNPGATIIGIMKFDSDDLDGLITRGTLQDVIQHEMLHVVGIGTLWTLKGLLAGARTVESRFTGALGVGACIGMGGAPVCLGSVPVENTGGPGTADGHWRKTTFGNELMTGFIGSVNLFSGMSIQSMADLGYQVNPAAGDAYGIPGLSVLQGSLQQTRASILTDMSPQWETVASPKMMMSKTGKITRVEQQ